MSTYSDLCRVCHTPFRAHRNTARYCSDACRAKASRDNRASLNARASALLLRQTDAIIAGADPAVLAAIAAEAQQLLVYPQ